ncbi:MAG: hypothetical protein V7603_4884 [Micromonosporaceae bacterium]
MGDFDAVLERLLVDQPFRAALAADPDRALAGYALSADEADLLRSQVSAERGGERTVETRNTKSSLFGMLGSLTGLAEGAGGTPGMMPPQPPDGGAQGVGQFGRTLGEFGAAPGHGSLGAAHGHGSLAEMAGQTGHTSQAAGFGAAGGSQTLGPAGDSTFGAAAGGHGSLAPSGDHTPVGYHPHIDADGDHHWDHYTAVQHSDGSVDIYEDRNHDGRVDFIGHDRNHDGLVESADYDKNFNGTLETHMRDVNGDGWLDTRTVSADPPPHGTEVIGEELPPPSRGR